MSRTRLLARRGAAHGGLLLLVLLLVAAMTAALGTTVGSVRAAEREIARESLAGHGAPANLVVRTRLRADAAEAQDAALRDVVHRTFGAVPVRVDRAVVADEGSDDPFVRWTLTPDVASAEPGDLGALASAAGRVLPVLRDDEVATERGVVVTGDLAERSATAAEAVRAAAAVTLVPLLLLALVGVVVLAQVARLLAATRETEVRLLAARGASGGQVAGAAAVEAVLLAGAGAGLGAGAAVAWLALRGVGPGGAGGAVAVAAATVAVAAALVLGSVAGLQGRRVVAGREPSGAGRGRRAAAAGTVVVAVAAAAVTLWMLRRHGSPLVPTPDGGQPDPVAGAAPALALVAVAALALALLGPLTRGWAALSARGRGAVGVLVARQVARRLAGAAVPVVLLVLAGGSAVLAGAYAGTAQRMQADAAQLAHGTDVRVVASDAADAPDVAADAASRGAAAAPALVAEGSAGDAPATLVALPPGAVTDVVRAPASTVDPAVLAHALDGEDPFGAAPVLHGATDSLVVTVSARVAVAGLADPGVDPEAEAGTGAWAGPASWPELLAQARASDRTRSALERLESSGVSLWLWLVDADGRLARVEAGRLDYDLDGDGDGAHPVGPAGRRHELVVDVPDRLRGDLRLVGLDVLAGGSIPWDTRVGVTVDAVQAPGDPAGRVTDPAEAAWAPAGPDTRTAAVPGDEHAGLGAVLAPADRETTPYRVLARGVGEAPARAVVTTSLAGRLDLRAGDRVELPVGRTSLPVEVTGVVVAVPGAGRPDAALVDLAGVGAGLVARVSGPPQPAETWVGTDGAGRTAAVARAVRAEVPSDGTVTVTTRPDAGPAVDAAAPVRAAFGVAAAGAATLAVVGLLAVASAALRARRPEVAVLRAVGVPPRVQGRLRAAEPAWVAAVSVLLGAAAGAAVAALTVPGLAGASLVGTGVEPVPVLTLAARDTAVPLATLLLGVLAVLAVTYARAVAQARDGAYREEVR